MGRSAPASVALDSRRRIDDHAMERSEWTESRRCHRVRVLVNRRVEFFISSPRWRCGRAALLAACQGASSLLQWLFAQAPAPVSFAHEEFVRSAIACRPCAPQTCSTVRRCRCGPRRVVAWRVGASKVTCSAQGGCGGASGCPLVLVDEFTARGGSLDQPIRGQRLWARQSPERVKQDDEDQGVHRTCACRKPVRLRSRAGWRPRSRNWVSLSVLFSSRSKLMTPGQSGARCSGCSIPTPSPVSTSDAE